MALRFAPLIALISLSLGCGRDPKKPYVHIPPPQPPGASGIAPNQVVDLPKGGLEARQFQVGGREGQKVSIHIETVEGTFGDIKVMTPADFDALKARWGSSGFVEYKYIRYFTLSGRDPKRQVYASDGPLPPGRYVAALFGSTEGGKVKLRVELR